MWRRTATVLTRQKRGNIQHKISYCAFNYSTTIPSSSNSSNSNRDNSGSISSNNSRSGNSNSNSTSASSSSGSERPFRRKKSGYNQVLYSGVPLLLFMIGGTYFLSVFLQTHNEIKDKQANSVSVRKFDIAKEHEQLMKKLDIDNFTLSRIPRPDELPKDTNDSKKKK